MSGSSLWTFVINFVELLICGAIIFAGLDYVMSDERFKKIARLALGGVIALAFLFALGGLFGFGGGAFAISPLGIIYFAIGMILLLVAWRLILLALDAAISFFPPLGAYKDTIIFVLSALMLIMFLLLAADLLFGAGIVIHSDGGRVRLR